MSSKVAKLAALGLKVQTYGLKKRAELVKEAAWLRIVQATIGVGAIKAATDASAAAELTSEVESLLEG